MKKIFVACAGAVATSTVAANKIKELCKREGIDADISQTRISELDNCVDEADLIVTTGKVKKDYGVPVVTGMAFISGVGIKKTEEEIISHLK